MSKDTFFHTKQTINCGGKLLDLSTPIVMGILNTTPDSFYEDSRINSIDFGVEQAKKMLTEGATIIDIGGYSTRPGADGVSIEQEIERTTPLIKAIKSEISDCIISIDTFRSEVAKNAINAGASIINDVSGGSLDDKMFATVGQLKVPYILTHIQGNPQNMQDEPSYENVVNDVIAYFSKKVNELNLLGVNDIILDPGFGFGKTIEHNYNLLANLSAFKIFNLPLLAGVSRKSIIHKLLNINSKESLNGTTTCNTISLLNGAKILRVHDVKEAMETIKIVNTTLANA